MYQSLNATNCLTNRTMKHWGDVRPLKSQVLSSVCASPCKCCLCSGKLRIHVIKMHKAKTIWISSQISGKLPCFLKFSIPSGIFHFIQEPFRLSGNSPDCPKISKAVQKWSRLFKNLPDFSGHFSDCWEIFQTVQKFSTLSWHFIDYWEIFNTLWKSSRLSGNLPDCLKIFQILGNLTDFGKSLRLSRTFPRLSGNLSDCPEIVKAVRDS